MPEVFLHQVPRLHYLKPGVVKHPKDISLWLVGSRRVSVVPTRRRVGAHRGLGSLGARSTEFHMLNEHEPPALLRRDSVVRLVVVHEIFLVLRDHETMPRIGGAFRQGNGPFPQCLPVVDQVGQLRCRPKCSDSIGTAPAPDTGP